MIPLLAACDSPRGLEPSQGLPTAPDQMSVPRYTLSGVVTSDGAPVAGARVIVWHGGAVGVEVASATTDANGQYSMSGVPPSPRTFGQIVLVSKPGYVIEFKYVDLSRQTRLDVAVAPWVHIAPNGVARGSVGDWLCEGSGPCERFALTPRSSGVLGLTSDSFPFDLEVLKPNGLLAASAYWRPGSSSPLQLSVPVEGGVTYEIGVYYPPGWFDSRLRSDNHAALRDSLYGPLCHDTRLPNGLRLLSVAQRIRVGQSRDNRLRKDPFRPFRVAEC